MISLRQLEKEAPRHARSKNPTLRAVANMMAISAEIAISAQIAHIVTLRDSTSTADGRSTRRKECNRGIQTLLLKEQGTVKSKSKSKGPWYLPNRAVGAKDMGTVRSVAAQIRRRSFLYFCSCQSRWKSWRETSRSRSGDTWGLRDTPC